MSDDIMEQTTEELIAKTNDDISELKLQLNKDLAGMKEQIGVLQSRVAALESQIARIEPAVEARNSRTERLVMDLQIDLHKFSKAFASHETTESEFQKNVDSMLRILIERTATEPL